MAIFAGGLLKFIARMWEFLKGIVFEAAALASYGCFWMSYATILIPGSGIIIAAYSDPTRISKRYWIVSRSLVHAGWNAH
ncbi:hypothetical protein BYT27DRAFT_7277666, partial [Phlegmacium glaucopus]